MLCESHLERCDGCHKPPVDNPSRTQPHRSSHNTAANDHPGGNVEDNPSSWLGWFRALPSSRVRWENACMQKLSTIALSFLATATLLGSAQAQQTPAAAPTPSTQSAPGTAKPSTTKKTTT